jgi:thymidylate synthase (FAD)
MKLIKPYFQVLSMTPNPLQIIEASGRTCYKSEDKITGNSAEKFVQMILNKGHETVLEHASVSVKLVVDRGVSHELVRHRIASFSQESTRYCDYNKGHITFIIPPWCDIEECTISLMDDVTFVGTDYDWFILQQKSEVTYFKLRDKGWKPEQARSVLTNSLKTEVIMTANLREWRHFFKLRTPVTAHPQMREITNPMLKTFKKLIPIVFDDIPAFQDV